MDTPEQPGAVPLGPRVELFTASRAQAYIGIVLGAVLTAGGLAMAGYGLSQVPAIAKPLDPKSKELAYVRLFGGLVVGGVVGFFGVVGFVVARSMVGTGIEVCQNGFRRWPPAATSDPVHWNDVERIEEQHVYDKVPLRLGGPLLSQTYRQFVVVNRNGEVFIFDRETVRCLGRLGKELREAAETHSIPWVVVGESK